MKKMLKNTALLLAAVILITSVLLSGCGSDENYPVVVGETKIKSAPQNVVALSANAADVMLNLGYTANLVGKSDSCTQSAIDIIPSFGSAAAPDVDAIIEANVDAVLADETLGEVYLNRLSEAGITVLRLAEPTNDSEIEQLYKTIGKIFGGAQKGIKNADAEYSALYKNLDDAMAQVSSSAPAYTVCYVYLDEVGNLALVEKNSFADRIITATGSASITFDAASGMTAEQILLQQSPSIILYDNAETYARITNNSELASSYAVANDRCFEYPLKTLNLVGISAIKNVSELLKLIYPDSYATITDTPVADSPVEPDGSIASQYGIRLTEEMIINADSDPAYIQALQQRLKDLNYYTGDADGEFGDRTLQCIKDFQYLNDFVVDGEADYDVLKVMFSDEAIERND